MLLFFIFAALGVELFGDLSKNTCSMHTGSQADRAQTKIHTNTSHSVQAQACTKCLILRSVGLICLFVVISYIFHCLLHHSLPAPPCTPVCDEFHPCEGLGRYATFKNFGMAFLLLFRVSTGDNWNGIMKVKSKTSVPLPEALDAVAARSY